MKTSQTGIDLIKELEGCSLKAYWDIVDYSIGYGHLGAKAGQTITKEEAEALLIADLPSYEAKVNKYDSIYHWTQNEFDALVSYAYNIGSIKGLVDDGKRSRVEIIADWPNHDMAGGKHLEVLKKRRLNELALFTKGGDMTTYGKKSIFEMIEVAEQCLDYLEKATLSDLGDLTPEGKVRNAGYNNYTLYWKWYNELTQKNYQGEPYCIAWVCLQFVRAFGSDIGKKLLLGEIYIYCPTAYTNFKNARQTSSTPHVGDIVLFWNNSLGRYAHAGLVVKVTTNGYVTYEANTSSGNNVVVRNGGATTRKSYTTGANKVIFLRPNYAAYGISMEAVEDDFQSYPVQTGQIGIHANVSMNVRSGPGVKYDKVGSVAENKYFKIDKKAFDADGTRWLHSEELGGWVSGKYLEGWIQEESGKWWYLLPDNKWYVDQLAVIDGLIYLFDSAGYMVTGETTVTLVPDTSGAISLKGKDKQN